MVYSTLFIESEVDNSESEVNPDMSMVKQVCDYTAGEGALGRCL